MHELNELDWKAALSPDKKRLREHLSAMANLPGGGFLVYGLNAKGEPTGINEEFVETTINQLTNIGRDGLSPSLVLDHCVAECEAGRLLYVYIQESLVKPVQIRGQSLEEAFIRSGATTRRASRQEIGTLMLNSRTPKWEELHSTLLQTDEQLLKLLEVEPILAMLNRPVPQSSGEMLLWMESEKLIEIAAAGGGYVTNLGGMAAARELADFSDLSRKAVRVIRYAGTDKTGPINYQQEGRRGYAIRFQKLLEVVMGLLPQAEVVKQGLRVKETTYPEIALREILANALIHQDFNITGAGPLVEIYDDRIEISNPGSLLPSKSLNRLIGTQPESRNEHLARAFRRYRICEELGSGLLKAGGAVESSGLPPIKFETSVSSFKVTLQGPKTFAKMSPKERLEACYQHAVLKHYSNQVMTNTSLRERMKMPEKQRSMISVLIQEAIEMELIKPADPENKSKKFAEYVPFWA